MHTLSIGNDPIQKTSSKQTAGRCRHAPAGFFAFVLMRVLHHFDDAVFFHLDGHPVLHIGQEFIAEAVDDGHIGVRPEGGEDRPGGGQRIDMLGKQHAGRLFAGGADRVKRHAAGGGADGLGKAERLAEHGFLIEVGVILVAAFDLFVARQHGRLVAGQGIEAAMGNQRLGLAGPGRDDMALKCFFHTTPSSTC